MATYYTLYKTRLNTIAIEKAKNIFNVHIKKYVSK